MSCPKGQYFCNDRQKCMPIPKGHKVRKDGELIKEVAPPSAKHERMIKHIKKRYAKDGKLTDKEKSIAYATAWKHYNKKEVKEGSSIIQGRSSSKKSSYRGPTGDHKRDKDGNIVASHYKKPAPQVPVTKKKRNTQKSPGLTPKTGEQRKDAVRKFDNYQKLKAKIHAKDDVRKKKAQEQGKKTNPNYGKSQKNSRPTFKRIKEEVILNIEIPSTPESFSAGLMFRESLDKDTGMLFVFDEVGEKSFHMRNTTIPLDIAFINEEGIIESIKELKPLDETYVYSDAEVLYALEVNRGWFEENNIKVGDSIISELNTKDVKKLAKASVLSTSDNPVDQDRARARQVDVDYKDLLRQRKLKKVRVGRSEKNESSQTRYYKQELKSLGQFRQDAKSRRNKEQSEKTREDTKKYGIKFTDSKGSGRIRDGRKHYD